MACQHLAAHLAQLKPPQLLALAVGATKSAVLSSALHAKVVEAAVQAMKSLVSTGFRPESTSFGLEI